MAVGVLPRPRLPPIVLAERVLRGLVDDEVAPLQMLVAAEDGAPLARALEISHGRGLGVDVAARSRLQRVHEQARRDRAPERRLDAQQTGVAKLECRPRRPQVPRTVNGTGHMFSGAPFFNQPLNYSSSRT